MPKGRSGMGRGLESIFADNTAAVEKEKNGEGKVILRLSDIEPRRDQPRKVFDPDALNALAESIAANGLIQPIVVRPTNSGFYQIIAGERRWRACKIAGLTEVPVIIMQLDDLKTSEIALVENLQRENLNPVEEAGAYKSLMEIYGLTQEELSAKVGKSRPYIANTIRLLDLPEDVLPYLSNGSISSGHARTLLGLKNSGDIKPLADRIVEENLSVRATESAVKAINARRAAEESAKAEEEKTEGKVEVDYAAELENSLSRKIGRRVRLIAGKGKRLPSISIEYSDNDDLQTIIEILTKNTENN